LSRAVCIIPRQLSTRKGKEYFSQRRRGVKREEKREKDIFLAKFSKSAKKRKRISGIFILHAYSPPFSVSSVVKLF
jgi:hypothetical protein